MTTHREWINKLLDLLFESYPAMVDQALYQRGYEKIKSE